MENLEEYLDRVICIHGPVHGLPGKVLEKFIFRKFSFESINLQGTANLQSSINAKDSLGTISLSAIYGALVVSCIFLPTLIIRKLTVKWALFFSMMCYAPYIAGDRLLDFHFWRISFFKLFILAAQFHPRFYTLIPVKYFHIL